MVASELARKPNDLDEDEVPATTDAEGLRHFLENKVLPWFENRRTELTNRPLIREQAFGEALDPDKLERLGRYEVHLELSELGQSGGKLGQTVLFRPPPAPQNHEA